MKKNALRGLFFLTNDDLSGAPFIWVWFSSNEFNDETYDLTVRELKELEKQYPELRLEDSPTVFLRGVPNTAFPTRTHKIPMLSLGNIYSFDDLFSWDVDVRKLKFDGRDETRNGDVAKKK